MSDLTPIYMILIYVPIYALLRPGRDRAGYNGIPARCRRIPVRDRNGDAGWGYLRSGGQRYRKPDGHPAANQERNNARCPAVPLSRRAAELLSLRPEEPDGEPPFGMTAGALDALFRKAKKLNVLDLARMVGHKDLRQLQVYYNETDETMAARMD